MRTTVRLKRLTGSVAIVALLLSALLSAWTVAPAAAAGNATLAWGSNDRGQLGNGSTTSSATPVPASGLDNVVQVAGGDKHSLALKSDGTVWAWGYNNYGQLGTGTTNYDPNPTPAPVSGLSGVTAIAAGGYHSLALKNDGTVWAWGYNSDGQLGAITPPIIAPRRCSSAGWLASRLSRRGMRIAWR